MKHQVALVTHPVGGGARQGEGGVLGGPWEVEVEPCRLATVGEWGGGGGGGACCDGLEGWGGGWHGAQWGRLGHRGSMGWVVGALGVAWEARGALGMLGGTLLVVGWALKIVWKV